MLAVWALLLAVAQADATSDVQDIDKAPESATELRTKKIEATYGRRTFASQTFGLRRGSTALVTANVTLRQPVDGPVVARTRGARSAGVELLGWIAVEEGETSDTRTVVYRIRADAFAKEGPRPLAERIVLYAARDGERVGEHTIQHEIRVLAARGTEQNIAFEKAAAEHFEAIAARTHGSLPRSERKAQRDRLIVGPKARKSSPDELLRIASFFNARADADSARNALRALALVDAKLEEPAIRALGSLTKRLSGSALSAKVIEGKKPPAIVKLLRRRLRELRIDRAEGIAKKARNLGLSKTQLAEVLAVQSAIHAARGRRGPAQTAIGQAFCIAPKLEMKFERPFFQREFETGRQTRLCRSEIRIFSATAERVVTDEGAQILVLAEFGEDPFRIITGGDIEVWGSGGEVRSAESVRTNEENGKTRLEATFADEEDMRAYGGRLLLRILAKDVGGVPIATFGDPDPVSVEIEDDSAFFSNIPAWVWVVAGGIVVAGAATAGAVAIASNQREDVRGLGPVTLTF